MPPDPAKNLPTGIVVVTKNDFFTYISGGGQTSRHYEQVWNVSTSSSSSIWNFHIYTGGEYTFNGKTENNCFHKKHLITLSSKKKIEGTIEGKSLSVFNHRTTGIAKTNADRNQNFGKFVAAIKPNALGSSGKEKTENARKSAGEIYRPKGYGNPMTAQTGSDLTLTVIDTSMFVSWQELALCFANALEKGANGPQSDQFVTGAIWHPTVDFGRNCVRICKSNGLDANSFSRAKVQVHLLMVDPVAKSVTCQVHHLSEAVQ